MPELTFSDGFSKEQIAFEFKPRASKGTAEFPTVGLHVTDTLCYYTLGDEIHSFELPRGDTGHADLYTTMERVALSVCDGSNLQINVVILDFNDFIGKFNFVEFALEFPEVLIGYTGGKKQIIFNRKKLKFKITDIHSLTGDMDEVTMCKFVFGREWQEKTEWRVRFPLAVFEKARDAVLAETGYDISHKLGIASCAEDMYLSQYREDVFHRGTANVRKLAIQAVHSGNREIYYRGQLHGSDIHMYDAVSAYPSSALQVQHLPTDCYVRVLKLDRIKDYLDGFAHVRFEFPSTEFYPCLPVKTESGVINPLAGEGVYTFTLLKVALQRGCKITLIDAWGYTREGADTTIHKFMSAMFALKTKYDHDRFLRHVFKAFANSLIGKMQQTNTMRVDWVKFINIIDEYEFLGNHDDVCRQIAHICENPIKFVLDHENDDAVKELCSELKKSFQPQKGVGSMYCPEWAAVILGYAYASHAQMIYQSKALGSNIDAVFTLKDLGDTLHVMGIEYKRKATGVDYVATRQQQYMLIDDTDSVVHEAHHSFYNSPELSAAIETGEMYRAMKAAVENRFDYEITPLMIHRFDLPQTIKWKRTTHAIQQSDLREFRRYQNYKLKCTAKAILSEGVKFLLSGYGKMTGEPVTLEYKPDLEWDNHRLLNLDTGITYPIPKVQPTQKVEYHSQIMGQHAEQMLREDRRRALEEFEQFYLDYINDPEFVSSRMFDSELNNSEIRSLIEQERKELQFGTHQVFHVKQGGTA